MEPTIKLYEIDAYMKECDATVLSEQVRGYDGLTQVVLNQTIFYPTGGGQPHDIGYINDVKVVDVYKEDDIIYHILEGALNGKTDVVARIDWERRFDHMQQHAGQHILSRAFEVILDADTVGFHLGQEIVTIDLDIEDLDNQMITAVEDLANAVVMENRFIKKEAVKAHQLSYEVKKKIPDLGEYVRMVHIVDYDHCACTGTHPHATSEVGIIKILGFEKYKQKIRLTFVCGNRALKTLRSFQTELFETAALLKTNWADVKNSVIRVQNEKKAVEGQLKDLKNEVLIYELDKWKSKGRLHGNFYFLEHAFENRDFLEIRSIAEGVTGISSHVVLFANVTKDKAQILLQRSDDIDLNMNDVLKIGLEILGGKGGGNPKIAQGGGQDVAKLNNAIEQMREYIFSKLS